MTRRIARVALTALAVASLPISACASHTSPPICESRIFVTLPDAGAVTIASVSTDPRSCGAYVGGTANVVVSSSIEGTCRVQLLLSNGNTYEFTVEFRVTHTGRCGNVNMVVDASVPALVDAGGA